MYCKRQSGHIYRSLRHPWGRPTILRELQAYRALSCLGIRTPNILYCAARKHSGQWQALLITEALQGFVSLEQWYEQDHEPSLKQLILQRLAVTLVRLHLGGWQHGCCYAKHIFVKAHSDGDVDIALLDLEKSRRRWRASSAARRDLSQLGRHRGAMPEADMLYLRQAYQQVLSAPWGRLPA